VDRNETRWDDSDWIDVIRGEGKWLASHIAVMNHRFAQNRVNFLIAKKPLASKERPNSIDLWSFKQER
jgi:hypothetical protein